MSRELDPIRSCLCNSLLIVTGAMWDNEFRGTRDEPGETLWSLSEKMLNLGLFFLAGRRLLPEVLSIRRVFGQGKCGGSRPGMRPPGLNPRGRKAAWWTGRILGLLTPHIESVTQPVDFAAWHCPLLSTSTAAISSCLVTAVAAQLTSLLPLLFPPSPPPERAQCDESPALHTSVAPCALGVKTQILAMA